MRCNTKAPEDVSAERWASSCFWGENLYWGYSPLHRDCSNLLQKLLRRIPLSPSQLLPITSPPLNPIIPCGLGRDFDSSDVVSDQILPNQALLDSLQVKVPYWQFLSIWTVIQLHLSTCLASRLIWSAPHLLWVPQNQARIWALHHYWGIPSLQALDIHQLVPLLKFL